VKLHRQLTLATALLLVVGVAIADVVTYATLHSSLYGRIDAQLSGAQAVAYRYLSTDARLARTPTADSLGDRVSPDVYILVLGAGGRVVLDDPSGPTGLPDPMPMLPRTLRVEAAPRHGTFGQRHGAFRPNPDAFDVQAVGNPGVRYRALAVNAPQGVLVVAVPLDPTEATLSLLLRIEVASSLAVVAVLCVLALLTVRRGLRPLEQMAETAGSIASGDLGQRVPVDDETSEVGRLGAALNVMLGRIESAFDEKSTSESRLRQFVADASHELRTPLTSIRGYAELLRKGGFNDPEGRERALARIEHEAARMGGLVDDLLLLARLDQGRPLRRTLLDLRRPVGDAVEDAVALDATRPIELVGLEPVMVMGDADRLGQVAHNLIRNALTHTQAGTPVHVTVQRRGTRAVLEVRDEGGGLDADQSARAFDRFYRGDASRTGSGTGLGLSIVRAIAEALGGEARVESRPGRGAVFTVELPAASTGPGVREDRATEEQPARAGSPVAAGS